MQMECSENPSGYIQRGNSKMSWTVLTGLSFNWIKLRMVQMFKRFTTTPQHT